MVSSSQLIRGEMMTEDVESLVASNICNKMDTRMITKSDGKTAADSIYVLFYDSE